MYSYQSSINAISEIAQRGNILRVYFSTDKSTWDSVHNSTFGNDHDGGIWKYTPEGIVMSGSTRYLLNRKKEFYLAGGDLLSGEISVWDTACNVGYFLKVLQNLDESPINVLKQMLNNEQPEPFYSGITNTYYGTDISDIMVEKTKLNCPTCVVVQFDLGLLREASWVRKKRDDEGNVFKFDDTGHLMRMDQSNDVEIRQISENFPPAFHFVVVSDVLIYIGWGGYLPLLLQKCSLCRQRPDVLEEQRNFIENLRSLTYNEIIVSDHQMNQLVVDMMSVFVEEGIAQWIPEYNIWIIPGTANQQIPS